VVPRCLTPAGAPPVQASAARSGQDIRDSRGACCGCGWGLGGGPGALGLGWGLGGPLGASEGPEAWILGGRSASNLGQDPGAQLQDPLKLSLRDSSLGVRTIPLRPGSRLLVAYPHIPQVPGQKLQGQRRSLDPDMGVGVGCSGVELLIGPFLAALVGGVMGYYGWPWWSILIMAAVVGTASGLIIGSRR
jgi:hypothetical protein